MTLQPRVIIMNKLDGISRLRYDFGPKGTIFTTILLLELFPLVDNICYFIFAVKKYF